MMFQAALTVWSQDLATNVLAMWKVLVRPSLGSAGVCLETLVMLGGILVDFLNPKPQKREPLNPQPCVAKGVPELFCPGSLLGSISHIIIPVSKNATIPT